MADGDVEAHQRFSFVVRAEIIRQLLQILEVSHSAGVVHRDIKPENIIIGACGEVTLIDWGIAVVLEEDNGKGSSLARLHIWHPSKQGVKGLTSAVTCFHWGRCFMS